MNEVNPFLKLVEADEAVTSAKYMVSSRRCSGHIPTDAKPTILGCSPNSLLSANNKASAERGMLRASRANQEEKQQQLLL